MTAQAASSHPFPAVLNTKCGFSSALNHGLSALDVYFAMGRGRQADGVDVPASEMKKWYVYP